MVCSYWCSKGQPEGPDVALPQWLQSDVRSVSLQCITLLIYLHGLLAVPTC